MLVLNATYEPINVCTVRRATVLLHLLEQAALSFELWTGTPAPFEVMSAAALAALADRERLR